MKHPAHENPPIKSVLQYAIYGTDRYSLYGVWFYNIQRISGLLSRYPVFEKSYNVLIENDETDEENEYVVGNSISLHLRSYYNVTESPNVYKKNGSNEKTATTWNCDQCTIIILHGKEVKVHDCPLYNNLYQMIQYQKMNDKTTHKWEENNWLNDRIHKTKGVNRTQTMRFYPSRFHWQRFLTHFYLFFNI